MPKAVGIDFGTTRSVVSVLEAGEPTVIPTAEGALTTPSVVGFTKSGELLVGEAAKRQAVANPDRTVGSVLRRIGSPWAVEIDGHAYTAEEISARILQKLRRDAESYLGDVVGQAVITVPSHFGQSQRRAIRLAGQIAGLDVLRVLNAPSAAVVGYGLFLDFDDDVTVLVFDLGGGTFDVSVLEIEGGIFEVKATSGSARLGGDDWDQRIVYWLVQRFNADHTVDLSKDKLAVGRLKEAAENAKVELSALQETQINIPYIAASAAGPIHLDYTLSRAKFQALTAHLVTSCTELCDQVIDDYRALLGRAVISRVLVVGGSTRLPAIQELVNTLPATHSRGGANFNPDVITAVGAAVYAGVLTGEVKDVLLLEATNLSLGIETTGGVTTRIVERNTTLFPAGTTARYMRCSAVFPLEDLQSSTEIHVVQGDHELAGANETIVRLPLGGTAPPAGRVGGVEVTIDVDFDGIAHATATRATPPQHAQPNQPRPDETIVVDRPYLRVTTKSIAFGHDFILLDEIDGVAYKWYQETMNGLTTKMERLFNVSSQGKLLSIPLNAWSKHQGVGEEHEITWRALVSLSNQIIEPRLAEIMVDRLRGGATLQIGGVTIMPSGLSTKTLFGKALNLTWEGFAGAELDKGQVVISAQQPGQRKAKTFAIVPSIFMNAVLLPPVLRTASSLFGS